MPTSAPLPAIADRLRERGWSHADVRCALDQPGAMAWVEGDGLVCAWGPPAVIHAVESVSFGPTAALLAEIVGELPAALELRSGPGAAGVLSRTHHIEMLGPIQRFRATSTPHRTPPKGLISLSSADSGRVRELADKEAPGPAGPLPEGWLGIERQGQLIAAVGPQDTGDEHVLIGPPAVHRSHRRSELGAELLATLVRKTQGQVLLDLRADRRNQAAQAEGAGFEWVSSFERWWCVRR